MIDIRHRHLVNIANDIQAKILIQTSFEMQEITSFWFFFVFPVTFFSDGYDLKVIIFSVTNNARKKFMHINRNSLHSDRKCRMRHT